jgi:hypothetical protein
MEEDVLKSLFTSEQGASHRPLDSSPQATGPAPWDLLTQPAEPRDRLTLYLNAWAGMDEAAWPEANVRALYDDIMDIFRDHPEADAWFAEWRAGQPEARIG